MREGNQFLTRVLEGFEIEDAGAWLIRTLTVDADTLELMDTKVTLFLSDGTQQRWWQAHAFFDVNNRYIDEISKLTNQTVEATHTVTFIIDEGTPMVRTFIKAF